VDHDPAEKLVGHERAGALLRASAGDTGFVGRFHAMPWDVLFLEAPTELTSVLSS
jgi:hypothetical protein